MNARIVVGVVLFCAALVGGCAYQVDGSEEEALDVGQEGNSLSLDEEPGMPAGGNQRLLAGPEEEAQPQRERNRELEDSTMPAPPPPWETTPTIKSVRSNRK